MKQTIPVGYSVPEGRRVMVPVDHTLITGRTQQSGKTTCAEAMAHHVGCPVLTFLTKPDEKGFRDARPIPLYNRDRADWEFVVSILEASLRKPSLKKGWIMRLCEAGSFKKATWKRPRTLADVLANCEAAWGSGGSLELTELRGYLRKVVPTMAGLKFTSKLHLANGINVMDLRGLALPVQFIVMAAALDWVYEHGQRMIVLIPEAQKFFPQGLNTPVKAAGERIIQEKGAAKVFLWLDTQMMRNLDSVMRGQMGLWLFGVQRDVNEARRTLEHIPDEPDGPPKPSLADLMRLRRGFFIASHGQTLVPHLYVQPFWVPDVHAQAIAMGEEDVASAEDIWDERAEEFTTKGADDEKDEALTAEDAEEAEEARDTDHESEGFSGRARSAVESETTATPRRLSPGMGGVTGNPDHSDGASDRSACIGRKQEENTDSPLSEAEQRQSGQILSDEYEEAAEAAGEARLDEIVEEARSISEIPISKLVGKQSLFEGAEMNAEEKELLELARTVGMEVALRELRARAGDAEGLDSSLAGGKDGARESDAAAGAQRNAPGESAARVSGHPRPLTTGTAANAALPPGAPAVNWPALLKNQDPATHDMLESVYGYIKARAQKEAPGILAMLAQQPELRVKIERPVIPAEGVLLRLAVLLKEGFFSNGAGKRSKAVEKEFSRRGWKDARAPIYKGMMELCRIGFLSREEVGKREYEYHAVPGMKITMESE